MVEVVEYVLLVLLLVSIALNIVLLRRVRQLTRELQEVGARVSITKEELVQIRKRLERMKGEI